MKKKDIKNYKCFFVSDLHGKIKRYDKLFYEIGKEKPDVVFMGGDLYPSFNQMFTQKDDFFEDILVKYFENLYIKMGNNYPEIYIILGNDDPLIEEEKFKKKEYLKYWKYVHNTKFEFHDFDIYGYANVPPTPFLNKDWEVYDVSRYVDPGCVHPTEGIRTIKLQRDIEFSTIKKDLEYLSKGINPKKSIFLFHSPPYNTNLDRAALDNMFYEYVPLDVHVGSIAIKEFIEKTQPYLTLHGHVHESTRITGKWKQNIGNTYSFNAAIDNDKLSIIIFDLKNLENARQKIL